MERAEAIDYGRMPRAQRLVGGAGGLAFGAIFFLVGAWIGNHTGPIHGGRTTTGRVVSLQRSYGSGGRITSRPVIAFTAFDGRKYQFVDPASSSFSPGLGASVHVW